MGRVSPSRHFQCIALDGVSYINCAGCLLGWVGLGCGGSSGVCGENGERGRKGEWVGGRDKKEVALVEGCLLKVHIA